MLGLNAIFFGPIDWKLHIFVRISLEHWIRRILSRFFDVFNNDAITPKTWPQFFLRLLSFRFVFEQRTCPSCVWRVIWKTFSLSLKQGCMHPLSPLENGGFDPTSLISQRWDNKDSLQNLIPKLAGLRLLCSRIGSFDIGHFTVFFAPSQSMLHNGGIAACLEQLSGWLNYKEIYVVKCK